MTCCWTRLFFLGCACSIFPTRASSWLNRILQDLPLYVVGPSVNKKRARDICRVFSNPIHKSVFLFLHGSQVPTYVGYTVPRTRSYSFTAQSSQVIQPAHFCYVALFFPKGSSQTPARKTKIFHERPYALLISLCLRSACGSRFFKVQLRAAPSSETFTLNKFGPVTGRHYSPDRRTDTFVSGGYPGLISFFAGA